MFTTIRRKKKVRLFLIWLRSPPFIEIFLVHMRILDLTNEMTLTFHCRSFNGDDKVGGFTSVDLCPSVSHLGWKDRQWNSVSRVTRKVLVPKPRQGQTSSQRLRQCRKQWPNSFGSTPIRFTTPSSTHPVQDVLWLPDRSSRDQDDLYPRVSDPVPSCVHVKFWPFSPYPFRSGPRMG